LFVQVPDFPDYLVNSAGQVYSLISGKLLKPSLSSSGYPKVNLYKDHQRHTRTVHSLVAVCWLGKPQPGMVVNHIDGDKQNNEPQNLEYCSPAENAQHAWRAGLQTVSERMREHARQMGLNNRRNPQ
jgi:hypothetical protein